MDCVERVAERRCAFFCFKFQVSGLRFWGCDTKFHEVLHRVSRCFFDVDCVERVAQRRCACFCFKFQVEGKSKK